MPRWHLIEEAEIAGVLKKKHKANDGLPKSTLPTPAASPVFPVPLLPFGPVFFFVILSVKDAMNRYSNCFPCAISPKVIIVHLQILNLESLQP